MATNPAQIQPATGPVRRSIGADFLVLAAIVALMFSLIDMGHEWHHPFQSKVDINLSPWYLPYYTMLSFMRGAVAYAMSFVFTLFYARWAAYDRQAERFLIPLLDILQSLPLSAFLVPIELALVAIFPHSNIGIELSCIIVIFTGQVWNLTFSFYYSLKALPSDFAFVGNLARFTPWQKFTQIELPFAAKGLVYNSMISLAGGWFFLSIIEAFTIGDQDFRVKGVGSYMSVAQEQKNGWAQFDAVVAVVLMVVAIDQLIFRPLIVWSNKFKIEDTESEVPGPLLRPGIFRPLARGELDAGRYFTRLVMRPAVVEREASVPQAARRAGPFARRDSVARPRPCRLVHRAVLGYGGYALVHLLWAVKLGRVAHHRARSLSHARARARLDGAEHAHRRAGRRVDRLQSQARALSDAVDADRRVLPLAAGFPESLCHYLPVRWRRQPAMGRGGADDARHRLVHSLQRDLRCQRRFRRTCAPARN